MRDHKTMTHLQAQLQNTRNLRVTSKFDKDLLEMEPQTVYAVAICNRKESCSKRAEMSESIVFKDSHATPGLAHRARPGRPRG